MYIKYEAFLIINYEYQGGLKMEINSIGRIMNLCFEQPVERKGDEIHLVPIFSFVSYFKGTLKGITKRRL